MFLRLAQGERAADKTDLAVIGEIGGDMGAAIGIGHFAITTQIDPAQDDVPARLIDEPVSFKMQAGQ